MDTGLAAVGAAPPENRAHAAARRLDIDNWPTDGSIVRAPFLCCRKDFTRAGDVGTVTLLLRDRDLVLTCETARDDASRRVAVGQVLEVTGSATVHSRRLTLDNAVVRPVGGHSPESFLPVTCRSTRETAEYLDFLGREEIADRELARFVAYLLDDEPLRAAWLRAPCGLIGNYAYRGGLLEHTVATASLAVELCSLHPGLDRCVVLTAALTHDLGLALARQARRPGDRRYAEATVIPFLRRAAGTSGLCAERFVALARCIQATFGHSPRCATAEATVVRELDALDGAAATSNAPPLASVPVAGGSG